MSDVPEFVIGILIGATRRELGRRIVDYSTYEGIVSLDVAVGPIGVDSITHWGSNRAARSIFGPSLAPAIEELIRGPLTDGDRTSTQYVRYTDLAKTTIGAAYGTLKHTPKEGEGLVEIQTFAQWIGAFGLEVKEAPEPLDATAFAAWEAMSASAETAEAAVVLPDPAAERARLDVSLDAAYRAAYGTAEEARRRHQVGRGLAKVLDGEDP